MRERIYTASVTFLLPEEHGFPTVAQVRQGIRWWAEEWSYADRGSGKVISAYAQRRPDLERRSKKMRRVKRPTIVRA
jgi:hypothetical protein